ERVMVAVAGMGRVETILLAHDTAHLTELSLGRAALGAVLEPRRITERTLVEAFAQKLLHPEQLVRIGRAVAHPDGGEAKLRIRHECNDVDGGLARFKLFEIVAERIPVERNR